MIDWSKEIEAIHPDGSVFKTTLIRTDDEGRMVRWLVGESPWSGMFTENGVAVLGGDWTIRNTPPPMEFGPEIKVDGKRPEWLTDSDMIAGYREQNRGGVWHSVNRSHWPYVQAIRLPANHPHYTTPTPDERAVAPELVSRLVAVVREQVHAHRNVTNPAPSLIEARAIVAALEPVVDTDVLAVRAIMHAQQRAMTPPDSGWGNMSYAKGSYDDTAQFKAALAAYRQLEKEGK